MNYYEVAPISHKIKLHDVATYESNESLASGTLVRINYRGKELNGVVLKQTRKPRFKTKPIEKIIDHTSISNELLSLGQWLSAHYGLGLPQALQTLLPTGIATKRQKMKQGEGVQASRKQKRPDLSDHQKNVIARIKDSSHVSHLLHGITGAGKTHIYIELIRAAFANNKDAILLVPEIALSAHLIERITPYFSNDEIVTLHSQQSERERHLAWQKIASSSIPLLVIGPRSAVFAPTNNLGVIIADEAHDSSFKQQQTPHYDALHVAAYRAHQNKATFLMGTATPDITSYYLAEHDRLAYHQLGKKFFSQDNHKIEIIDRKERSLFSEDSHHISTPLVAAITSAATNKKQSLLFINRRGFATNILCTECSWVMECPRCQLPLTYHKTNHKAQCHLCGQKAAPPLTCPECQSAQVQFRGTGTQRIEEEVGKLFTNLSIARIDRDSTSDDPQHREQLMKADIIVGTQMIGKGFDLPRLAVVGVINADAPLFLPDYRAGEEVFQQLTQVIGRNDRRGQGGRTYLQTSNPEHYAVHAALHGDYKRFYDSELAHRKIGGYPPFSYLLKITAQRKTTQGAQKLLQKISTELQPIGGLKVLGPTPSFYEHAHGHKTWHLLLKSSKRSQLVDVARQYKATDVICELDPYTLL